MRGSFNPSGSSSIGGYAYDKERTSMTSDNNSKKASRKLNMDEVIEHEK